PEAVLAAIERYRVTVLAAVSTQFVMLLNSAALDDHDLSSLRVMFTGGEMVPYDKAREFETRTGATVLQFYGSNETGALSATTMFDTLEQRLRTAVPMPDETFGERVCVFAELRAGFTDLRLDDLTAHLAARGVGKELWPERLVVMGE